jgi:hypothetical protein
LGIDNLLTKSEGSAAMEIIKIGFDGVAENGENGPGRPGEVFGGAPN